MNARDRRAMRAAIAAARNEDRGRREQVDAMLRDQSRSWEQVGHFCAYHCQTRALGLPPWQRPPCLIEDPEAGLRGPDDLSGRHNAARLLQRMRQLRISKFDPDPMAAIAEAEAKTRPRAA
jgi:hypothetical protein